VNGAWVIALAVAASTGLFALWSWGMDRLVARQQRQEAERLQRERHEPPVLGGAPRHRAPGRYGR
jgi:hypothetical protein